MKTRGEYGAGYRARHPERVAAAQIAYDLKYPGRRVALARVSKDKLRRTRGVPTIQEWRAGASKKWAEQRELDGMAHLSLSAAKSRRYAMAHPEKVHAKRLRRRLRRAQIMASGLLVVDARGDQCGVCLGSFDLSLQWPDLMSRSIGHEPPLARVVSEGWLIVCERWEHLGCNMRKGTRLDVELDNIQAA